MLLYDVSENVSPTLVDGSFDVYFGKFEQIKAAMVTYDQSMNLTNDSSGQLDMSYSYNPIPVGGSLNYVRVYMTYKSGNPVSGGKVVGTTAMLNNKKVVVLAFGQ